MLARVREAGLAAFAHQDVPFEKLVDVLAPERSLARHPLFQVMLTVQNTAPAVLELPGLHASPLPGGTGRGQVRPGASTWPRSRDAAGEPAGLRGALTAAADLFDPATAAMIAARFTMVLRAVVADPQVRLSRLDLLDPAERAQVLEGWNDTARVGGRGGGV